MKLKIPYYLNNKRPWHDIFHMFRWYRKLTKGVWKQVEINSNYITWIRYPNDAADYKPTDTIKMEDWT